MGPGGIREGGPDAKDLTKLNAPTRRNRFKGKPAPARTLERGRMITLHGTAK
jgi:hypothetical protein